MVHLPNWRNTFLTARWRVGDHSDRSFYQVSFRLVRVSDRQPLGAAMASVRAYACQWKADSASSFEGRAFARVLLQCLNEIVFVATCAPGRRIDCALSGGEKKAGSIMATSGALYSGFFLHNLLSSWNHRGRVRSRRCVARVLLLQFSSQPSSAS